MGTRMRMALALIVLAVVACAAPSHEPLESRGESLSIAGLTPWPCDANGNRWEGDTVQLLVADAWVGCSAKDGGLFDETYSGNDPYLQQIIWLMHVATASDPQAIFQTWWDFRQETTNNCDPVTGKPALAGVLIPKSVIREEITTSNGDKDRRKRANADLRQAGVNLCIAQRLRNASPGASAGETLLLPEADQRLLLETIRERAQIAMLQYALLGVVFSTSPQASPVNPHASQTIPLLQQWAADNQSSGRLMDMGRDFSAAVQLHSMVSQELLELFARSRSARSPRGGQPATRADELWGPGSWHQRTLAAAFGGDPLVPTDGTTPWTHWNPHPSPISGYAGVATALEQYGWPSALKRPYSVSKAEAPQVDELLRLARQYDHLDLIKDQLTPSCEPYLVEESARSMYKLIEGEVRLADCYRASATDPCPVAAMPPPYDYGQGTFVLYEKYRITMDHARALVRVLAESLGGRKSSAACGTSYDDAQFGARNLEGTVSDQGGSVKFDKAVAFGDVSPWEVAPTYTRLAAMRFPSPWDLDPAGGGLWDVASHRLGFDDYCVSTGCPNTKNAEAKRLMGALSAQAAVRDMVVDSLAYLDSGLGQTVLFGSYFAQADSILKLVEASGGVATVSVKPEVYRDASGPVPVTFVKGNSTYEWEAQVKVIAPSNDPWWDSTCTVAGCSVVTGAFAIRGPWARMLAAQPTSSILGTTLLDSIGEAFTAGRWAFGASFKPSGGPFVSNMPKIWAASPLRLPQPLGERNTYTLVAVRVDFAAPAGQQISYRLLGANIRIAASDPRDAQYLAGGGALGGYVARQSAVRSTNPSEPAFDGFDLPTNWVPPLNAELIGGAPGEASAGVYLKLAKESAATAKGAVESALQELLQQQQDEATLAAAAGKASAGIKEERDRLCGNDNPTCDTTLATSAVQSPISDCVPTGKLEPELSKCKLQQFAFDLAKSVAGQELKLAKPVADALSEPTVPAFSAYQGGSLQASFIEQWVAVRAIPTKLDLLQKTVIAANTAYDASWAALQAAGEEVRKKCEFEKMKLAFYAGFQVHGVDFQIGPDASYEYDFDYDAEGDMSMGPILAQINACESALAGAAVAGPAVVVASNSAMLEVASAAAGLIDAVGAVRLAASQGAALVNEAQLAQGRHELEQRLTQDGLVTSFSVYRISRGYDLWRAKALVESSRRYALAARRSVEARYVVDLSQLDKDEAFVASPKVWADEVYGYDLTLPAAVGLTLTGSSKGDAVYPAKLSDYVANLEGFVAGYAVTRPTAIANNDIDVITLRGLAAGESVEVPLDPSNPGSPTITAHPSRGPWVVRCVMPGAAPSWTEWPTPCDGKVDRAKLLFSLDPWGRVNGAIADEPFDQRHNARWGLLAVNFVGTGIRDCQNAVDPKGCYSEPFIRYNLTHVGPSWVTDYDGRWNILGLSTGKIEAGKGLAAEIWLDPLKDGWSTSYISAAARSEWQHRPLGGAYELEFQVTPDIQLDRIERLQVLVGSTSWVKQQ